LRHENKKKRRGGGNGKLRAAVAAAARKRRYPDRCATGKAEEKGLADIKEE
jgi:hypothetical protein